jgi:hypothetical protein
MAGTASNKPSLYQDRILHKQGQDHQKTLPQEIPEMRVSQEFVFYQQSDLEWQWHPLHSKKLQFHPSGQPAFPERDQPVAQQFALGGGHIIKQEGVGGQISFVDGVLNLTQG